MTQLASFLYFFLVGFTLFPVFEFSEQDDIGKLDLTKLKLIGETEEKYQSFNVEMCEVIGGDFWIPYNLIDTAKVKAEGFAALKHKMTPINLYDEKLRTLADGLGPFYVRVSGTWANAIYFQDNDLPKMEEAPEGYENVLTRKEWKGVIDFCKATGAKLVTSFSVSEGIRDGNGNWTPAQLKPLLDYTKELGGQIYAAEMFNEPSHASHGNAPEGYDAKQYAEDFKRFKAFVAKEAPDMIILGPGSTGEGGIIPGSDPEMATEKILSQNEAPEFDVFSYHYYGSVSQRCRGPLTPEMELGEEWLSKTEEGLKFYEEARDKYLPEAPIWLTETAEAACGGNPWAQTYVDTFRYLEQLGRLAKKNVQVVMHNTLSAGEYAILDQGTHDPRPNYWAALLWNKLMGEKVYNLPSPEDGIDVFAHSLKGGEEGIAVLIVNPNNKEASIEIPKNARKYLLSSDDLLSKNVKLNGETLKLGINNELPEIKGENVDAGELKLPPRSHMFLVID